MSRLLTGLTALALFIASCAASVSSPGTESDATNPGSTAASATETEPEAAEGPTAPLLVGLADGGQLDWNSLEGKDVMLWFWAPW